MIEVDVIQYLTTKNIANGKVYAEVPATLPSTYVVIEKTSGGTNDKVNKCMIAIKSISTDLLKTMQLNEAVKTAMETIADTVSNIYGCELNSDYNFTDTTTKEYRYQAVFNLYYA